MTVEGNAKTEDLLVALLRTSASVLIKRLSNNDRDWARYDNKHQAGVYVPAPERDGGFFPALTLKERDPAQAAILETWIRVDWPQVGERNKRARLVNYRSKGEETHLTGLPKEAFASLAPASFLVIGRSGTGDEPRFEALTIDATDDAAAILTDALRLPVDFQALVRFPDEERRSQQEQLLSFADLLLTAWRMGSLVSFAAEHAAMPDTYTLASMARQAYLDEHQLAALDPFEIECPGDAVRHISRVIELEIFRGFQRKRIATEIVQLITGNSASDTSGAILARVVENVGEIDALMLSASQQRRSRAGYSFEHHIEAMLLAGRVPFEKQVVIDAKKRPDFILPSWEFLNRPKGDGEGFILSAKTTLRERWKQVQREMSEHTLFLATVDDSLAGNAIEDMASMGITLVVPEILTSASSKAAKAAEYRGHSNVVTFRQFFDTEIRDKRLRHWSTAEGH
ncbi:MAG: type II restriction endonuclease [Brevundimonas sp.]|uniref:type II restriction endonuclease n=1 Tax=Brevundimonas sp. TaxID=1871086 RepID=UPI002732A2C7|nr:type II restriction endonuclease [Brevundimonas sp.]MDP3379285.1 type II restriction endonuclease [Brevundimonas sp.]